MANKKITELTLVDEITDDLNLPTDDTLQTYRLTIAQIKAYLAPIYLPPSRETKTTVSGSGTLYKHYTFICGSASATVGATYTNNSNTYTVVKTIASQTRVVLAGPGDPTASGTLTKSGGTGDATITFSQFRAPIWARGTIVGCGGGGAGGGAAGASSGGTGGNTTLGTMTAYGGGGGINQGRGGQGGAADLAGFPGISSYGGDGGGPMNGSTAIYTSGGIGGGSLFGTGGYSDINAVGNNANAYGSGGGGGGADPLGGGGSGGGGGAGGSVQFFLAGADLPQSLAWAIGAKGTAGAGGSHGFAGGTGQGGIVDIEWGYQ